jgi:AAA+ superfamily predicted ATPase
VNAQVEIAGKEKVESAAAPVGLAVLSPSQQIALKKVEQILAVTPIVALTGGGGQGRTTILKLLAQKYGGELISVRDIMAVTTAHAANVSDARIGAYILEMIDRTDLMMIDDFHSLLFANAARPYFFPLVAVKAIYDAVIRSGKRLVVAGARPDQLQSAVELYGDQAAVVRISGFTPLDYAAFAQNILGKQKSDGIDFKLVYRYASVLNGHQLRLALSLFGDKEAPDADAFIDCLVRHHIVTANTRIEEVEALSFDSLPGAEHIVSKLETHIVLPLENRVLAQKLKLKPKRGVLLYGPPGTGKTSIGRALAHRMQGKFFLIDGSFVTEPPGAFFEKLSHIVEEAKANSPSVLFIDDADVLFTIDHIAGLPRFLLSLLDGLESETASNVCVMMTAMDVRRVPDALLRSGRVELWLETKEPDEETRARILQRWMGEGLPDHDAVDYPALAKATEGFTPADLRRIAGDAKALYASDKVRERKLHSASEYLRRAIDNVVAVRSRMADSLGDESLRVGEPRKKSKYATGGGGMAAAGTSAAPGW